MSSPGLALYEPGFAAWEVLRLLPTLLALGMLGTILAVSCYCAGQDRLVGTRGDPTVNPHPPPHAEGRQPGQWVSMASYGKQRRGAGSWHLPFCGHLVCVQGWCCPSHSGV